MRLVMSQQSVGKMQTKGKRPKVSIGLPAYKGQFFREALQCWVDQTFSDFEVLVYDDASPDDLKSIFDEVCGADPRFRYVRNKENSSPRFVRNWNKTLAAARGEYFVLGSDDDVYDKTFLEKMVAAADQNPGVDLFYCRYARFSDDIKKKQFFSSCAPRVESQTEYVYALLCEHRLTIAPNYFMRRSAAAAMGGFVDLPAAWASDWLSWAHLARHGVVFVSEVLLYWRANGRNISTKVGGFWDRQKCAAGVEAEPLWMQLIASLTPRTEAEAWQKAQLLAWMKTGYFMRQIWPYALLLPWRCFIHVLLQEKRAGRLSRMMIIKRILLRIYLGMRRFFA